MLELYPGCLHWLGILRQRFYTKLYYRSNNDLASDLYDYKTNSVKDLFLPKQYAYRYILYTEFNVKEEYMLECANSPFQRCNK